MKDILARDIMIPLDKYPHIPYWFSLRQAIAEMENFQLDVEGRQSLPRVVLVFNEEYQLLGTVRRRDIMRGVDPRFGQPGSSLHERMPFELEVDSDLAELSGDRLLHAYRERSQRPVSEVMRPIDVTVHHDDHLSTVLFALVKHDISLVPVRWSDQIVGVVRTVDAFRQVARIVL